MILKVLSGGAAQGLVQTLAPKFKAETGCDIDGSFGAVGGMRERLVGGAPADLVILTAALVRELAGAGHVRPDSIRDIGVVETGVAVRRGDRKPPIGDAPALRAALLAADGIYVPDLKLSTAGIHFSRVLEALGIRAELESRLRDFPNGNAAMQSLAQAQGRPIGCTQVTEILNTPGVVLVGKLPKEFELATVYTAGVCARSRLADMARRFADMLASATAEHARFGFSAAR